MYEPLTPFILGWFRVLEDETVPLKIISSVARVMPVSFLSSKKVTGFSLLDPANTKDIMYEKLQYPPGLYYVHNIYEDYVKYKDNKHVTKRKLLRCLVCVAEEGLEVLFPFDVEGDFYIVEAKKAASKSAVNDKNSCAYTLKQLVAMGAFTRPLVLQVLIGEPPTKPCGFTSVVKVFDIIQERSVIASCLDGSRRLMELPVLPYPQFLRALNGKDLLETGSLRPELMFMSGGAADKYAREIKVRQNIPLQENDKILAAQHFEKQLQKQPVQSRSPRRAADRSKPPLSQSLDSKLTEKPMFKQYPIEGNLPRKSTDKQTEIQTREKQSPVDVEENHIYINPFEGQLSKPKKDKQKFTNAKVKQGSKDTSNNKKI